MKKLAIALFAPDFCRDQLRIANLFIDSRKVHPEYSGLKKFVNLIFFGITVSYLNTFGVAGNFLVFDNVFMV